MAKKNLWRALVAMSPQLVAQLMSFLTLGIFWAGQYRTTLLCHPIILL